MLITGMGCVQHCQEQKKLRSRGGFQVGSALSHMNRQKHKHAGENQNKPNLRKKEPMQTKQSVINSNIRATVIAAFGVLSMVFAVSETAQAQATNDFRRPYSKRPDQTLPRFRAQWMHSALVLGIPTISITQARSG